MPLRYLPLLMPALLLLCAARPAKGQHMLRQLIYHGHNTGMIGYNYAEKNGIEAAVLRCWRCTADGDCGVSRQQMLRYVSIAAGAEAYPGQPWIIAPKISNHWIINVYDIGISAMDHISDGTHTLVVRPEAGISFGGTVTAGYGYNFGYGLERIGIGRHVIFLRVAFDTGWLVP